MAILISDSKYGSDSTTFGIKEFICDTEEEIAGLPTDITEGSSALVVATAALYILISGTWKKVGG